MLIAGAATAEGAGGIKATLSTVSPTPGSCSVLLDATWHPKPGQAKVILQAFDTTTGRVTTPVTEPGTAPTDRAAATDFPGDPFLPGGPDVWIGKAFLYDMNNNVLAQTTSKRYTFNCTL